MHQDQTLLFAIFADEPDPVPIERLAHARNEYDLILY